MVIDEEITTSGAADDTPVSEPAPVPEPDPIPDPEPESEPVPEPEPVSAPEPEEPAAPVEVVTVDDLLDRLTEAGRETAEETAEPEEEPQEESAEVSEESVSDEAAAVQVVGMDTVIEYLEAIQGSMDHPVLTTPFEDYTVIEGLLLLLFLSVFVMACVKLLKGGFAWLR